MPPRKRGIQYPRRCGHGTDAVPKSKIQWLLDRPLSRAMTVKVWPQRAYSFSRRDPPEVCTSLSLIEKREQGMPGARCTRGLVCKFVRRKRTRAYRFSGGNPTFPAQWFYGLLRAPPGDQDLFVTVAPRMMAGLTPGWAGFASARLDANHEASGPHDFAVREPPGFAKRRLRA